MTLRHFCTLLAAAGLACLVEAAPALAGSGSSFAQASSRGSIVASKSCTDRLGSGEIVLVEEREREYACGGDAPCRDKYIHAYRFADDEQIWQINDLVEDCPFSPEIEFLTQGLRITDLDDDGLNEIWVVYRLGCRSDVSPLDMKIIMYEGRKKYAIRGSQRIYVDGSYDGGEYKMDAAFREGPESFRRYGKNLWIDCANGQ